MQESSYNFRKEFCIREVEDRLDKIPKHYSKEATELEIVVYTIREFELKNILSMFIAHLDDSNYPGNSYLMLLCDRVSALKNEYEHGIGSDYARTFNLISYETADDLLESLAALDYI